MDNQIPDPAKCHECTSLNMRKLTFQEDVSVLNWCGLFWVAVGLFTVGYLLILGMVQWSMILTAMGIVGGCFYGAYYRYVI